MRNILSLMLLVLVASVVNAQQDSTQEVESKSNDSEEQVFFAIEKKAEFPGGDYAFSRYIAKNLEYPEDARKNSVEGKVFIQFDIDTAGNVINAEIIDKRLTGLGDSKDDYCLGQCALDVVESSPKWTPASQRGKNVKMRMRIPISFKLR